MARGVPFSPDEDKLILELSQRRGDGDWKVLAGRQLNRNPNACYNRLVVLRARTANVTDTLNHAAFANTPLSLKDVIRLWDIDETIWEAVTFQPNQWEIGAKHPETFEILTKPLYQTKVSFRRKKSATMEQIAKQVVADIALAAKRFPQSKGPALHLAKPGDVAAEFDLFDIHLGKYAWGEQTGQPYDTGICEQIAKAALLDLTEQVKGRHRITQIILPVGNDFYQVDTIAGTTTAGTHVDRDTRFQRMFRCGHQLAMWMIHECAKIAPVHVPVVPGNHDATAAFTMGVVLEAEFRNDKRITFDNSPKPRKYVPYGGNLIGFTHGDKEKPRDLPGIMSVERKQDWARAVCAEFHIGHVHHGKQRDPMTVEDMKGCTVRWIRSLSAADAWHNENGYIGMQRSAEAFLWRKEGGMRGHFVSLPVEELVA